MHLNIKSNLNSFFWTKKEDINTAVEITAVTIMHLILTVILIYFLTKNEILMQELK